MTLESFAVAALEVVPNDAKCVLDITDLVHAGWTEAYDDLIEYSQQCTNFYVVFQEAIAEIKSLATSLPGNPILARLLHANAITAMETYLADSVKKNVMNRPALLRRFVQSHPGFAEEKFRLAQVFTVHDEIKTRTSAALNQIAFHNMAKTMKIYESVFSVEFPKEDLPELFRAVQRRHDIIHRNGRDISGHVIDVTASDLEAVIDLVTRTMSAVDKQIKDSLIDDEDGPPDP